MGEKARRSLRPNNTEWQEAAAAVRVTIRTQRVIPPTSTSADPRSNLSCNGQDPIRIQIRRRISTGRDQAPWMWRVILREANHLRVRCCVSELLHQIFANKSIGRSVDDHYGRIQLFRQPGPFPIISSCLRYPVDAGELSKLNGQKGGKLLEIANHQHSVDSATQLMSRSHPPTIG